MSSKNNKTLVYVALLGLSGVVLYAYLQSQKKKAEQQQDAAAIQDAAVVSARKRLASVATAAGQAGLLSSSMIGDRPDVASGTASDEQDSGRSIFVGAYVPPEHSGLSNMLGSSGSGGLSQDILNQFALDDVEQQNLNLTLTTQKNHKPKLSSTGTGVASRFLTVAVPHTGDNEAQNLMLPPTQDVLSVQNQTGGGSVRATRYLSTDPRGDPGITSAGGMSPQLPGVPMNDPTVARDAGPAIKIPFDKGQSGAGEGGYLQLKSIRGVSDQDCQKKFAVSATRKGTTNNMVVRAGKQVEDYGMSGDEMQNGVEEVEEFGSFDWDFPNGSLSGGEYYGADTNPFEFDKAEEEAASQSSDASFLGFFDTEGMETAS